MKYHKLFDIVKLSLPDDWTVELEVTAENETAQPQALKATAFNEADEQGHLSINCFRIATESHQQQQQLLSSVFAETDKTLLGNHVYWGMEELQGEEQDAIVAIKRWLVCSLQKAQQFNLLVFSYTVAADSLSDDLVVTEISQVENAIKSIKWL